MRSWGPTVLAIFVGLSLGCSAVPDDWPKGDDSPGIASPRDTGDAALPRDADSGDVPSDAKAPSDGPGGAIDVDLPDISDAKEEPPPGEEPADASEPEADAEPTEDAPTDAAEDGELDGDADAEAEGGEGGDADGDAEEPDDPPFIPAEPESLEEAGLYSDFDALALAPGIRFYEPAFKLWSDGAFKERYLYLPKGTVIDASDPDEWIFPIGTRLYKTFSVKGRPVETRFLQKNDDGWFMATYAWNATATATQRVTAGVRNALGTGYDIPEQYTCASCHRGAADRVLGFELIGLANEGAAGLELSVLNAEGLLSPKLLGDYTVPGGELDKAALGWLHANCGTACHNDLYDSKGYWTGFYMRLDSQRLASVSATYAWQTGAYVTSDFQPGGPTLSRIFPGDPARSAIYYRASRRGSTEQMPPYDTKLVDEEGLESLRAWIEGLH